MNDEQMKAHGGPLSPALSPQTERGSAADGKDGPEGWHKWHSASPTWERLKPAARTNRKGSTEAEAALWSVVRRAGLGYKFRRQHAVGPYIVDFFCPAARLAVEVDGPIHQDQTEADGFREEFLLETHGISVLRFRNDEVLTDLDSVRERIVTALNIRISEFPSPFAERG